VNDNYRVINRKFWGIYPRVTVYWLFQKVFNI